VNSVNHYFVDKLYYSADSFKRATRFDWLQCFNNRSGFERLNKNLNNRKEDVFLWRSPNILRVILSDTFAFKQETSAGYD